MTQPHSFEADSQPPELLMIQYRQQEEADRLLEQGTWTDAVEPIITAGVCRDEIHSGDYAKEWAITSSVKFNQALHGLLSTMVRVGDVQPAKNMVANRLRTTTDAYEACGLHYWIGVEEAQEGNLRLGIAHAKQSEEVAEAVGSHSLAAQTEGLLSRMHQDAADEPAAKDALVKALDNIERASSSDLYIPPEYILGASYAVKHRLRFYLGERLFYGREREARNFCDEVLTASSDPSRLGFLNFWIGQADMLHTQQIARSKYNDVTKPALHLKIAENYFVAANEPVYAGFVVVDQGELGDLPRALERAKIHLKAAIRQYEQTPNGGLAMEIDSLMKLFQDARRRTAFSLN